MIAAVIPARNEERRVARAIAALADQGVRRILVVANGCADATAEQAAEAGAEVVEVAALAGGVGEARAIGCSEALRRWTDARILVSTDADGTVGAGCLAALRRALEGADAAMGRLVCDAGELAALPRHVARVRTLQERRAHLLAELGSLSVPRPHDPAPRHLDRAGGLMAFRREAYTGVGGFRPLPAHEDRDIAARLAIGGYRTAHPWHATVTVSCRVSGRAPEGMAASFASQVALPDGVKADRLASQCARLERLVRHMRGNRAEAARLLADLVRPEHASCATDTGGPERTVVTAADRRIRQPRR